MKTVSAIPCWQDGFYGESPMAEWARRFQALAQNGLAYCKDPYDRERSLPLKTQMNMADT
jgi:Hydrolase of X-linked nucleoside diphosphate N terminal